MFIQYLQVINNETDKGAYFPLRYMYIYLKKSMTKIYYNNNKNIRIFFLIWLKKLKSNRK